MFKVGDRVKLVKGGAISPEMFDYTKSPNLSIGDEYIITDIDNKKSGLQWVRINKSSYWFVSEHFKLAEELKYIIDFDQDEINALTALSWHIVGVKPTRDVFTTDWGTDEPLYRKYATIHIEDHGKYVLNGCRLEILKNVGENNEEISI